MSESGLCNAHVRIVMAGRYSLSSSRYQRLFQQYVGDLITETRLDKFNEKETKNYLQEIGIEDEDKIRQIWKATKGYPYYLNLIKDQKEQGKEIKLYRGGKDIVDLLLQGLNETEKKVVTLAAYCRWFDEQLIEYLLGKNSITKPPQNHSSWFEWLIELDFIIENEHYSLDDVARDIIRQTEHKNKEKGFQALHQQLADYFQERADVEVEDEESLEEQYDYPEWCEFTIESIYHSLYANKKLGQIKLLTYFFQGAYFKKPEIAMNSYGAVVAESDLEDNEFKLLPGNTKSFLKSVSLSTGFGWLFIDKNPKQYQTDFELEGDTKKVIAFKDFQQGIESSLEKSFKQINKLEGVAKCWGLIGIFYRSNNLKDKLRVLEEAKSEIEKLKLFKNKELCSKIYYYIGNTFRQLKEYDESLKNVNNAIDINSRNADFWMLQGVVLAAKKQYKEALLSCNKAIEIDSSHFIAWHLQGIILSDLGEYQRALNSYDKSLDANPQNSLAWCHRSDTLSGLGKYQEAL